MNTTTNNQTEMTMSDDPVVQDLGRHMDGEDKAQAEHNKELEQAEDMVSDLHITINGLENREYEKDSEVVYSCADSQLTITIDMSEVEGEAFLQSLDRKSTSKYIVEKTWIDKSSPYKED